MFNDTSLKKNTSGFLPGKAVPFSEPNVVSVVFHRAVTVSVEADTEDRGFPPQRLCLCVVHV